jgi:shikimate dehydrogenase
MREECNIMIDITGKTQIIGLIGNPVEHSISPKLHNTLCKHFNLDMVYLPFQVLPKDIVKVIDAFRALNILGFNVTIPHKSEIVNLIDDISEEALLMGAVNTVKNVDGRLKGFNTDGEGFARGLKAEGIDVKGMKVVVLGAGGAARAVAIKLAQDGAEQIIILNRSQEKAQTLSNLINDKVKAISNYDELSEESLMRHSNNCDMIINTTPIGMWPHISQSPISNRYIFKNKPVVYDLIYNPIKTEFLRIAEQASCRTINGLGMLVYQGIYAFEIWNQISVPNSLTRKIINSI